ncbi:nephrocystin-1 [Anaeramoeba flamelloides]|uniref:Nephrocystin-1 n=1 Tax=Anaeramoeba flamelloides TaxID=1746091 RepID=A0ABQ8XWV5_9EUKA|nr:nephrocystin-1 [Anaeramoeba flamelloides]
MNDNYSKLQNVLSGISELRELHKETNKQHVALKKMKETYLKTKIEYKGELDTEIDALGKQVLHLKQRRALLTELQQRLSAIAHVSREFPGRGPGQVPVAAGDRLWVLVSDQEGWTTGKLIGTRRSRKGKVPTNYLTIEVQPPIPENEWNSKWGEAESHLKQFQQLQESFKKTSESSIKQISTGNTTTNSSDSLLKPFRNKMRSESSLIKEQENVLESPISAVVCFDWKSRQLDQLSVKANERVMLVAVRNDEWGKVVNSTKKQGFIPLNWIIKTKTFTGTVNSELMPKRVIRPKPKDVSIYFPEWMKMPATNNDDLKKENKWLRDEVIRLRELVEKMENTSKDEIKKN